MSTTTWKDIAELVGIAAIVASLVFVGLQMKQSHEIALAEIYQARTGVVAEATISMASNPFLLAAYMKRDAGQINDIDPMELLATEWAASADLMLRENSHYQYTLGYLPKEHWMRVRSLLKNSMQDPLEGRIVDKYKPTLSDSFRQVIEEIEMELASDDAA